MKPDFSLPQYQSTKGIIILALISFGKIIRNFWFIIIYIFYKNGISSLPVILSISAALLFLVLFNAFLNFHYFTYQIDFENNKFIIKKGIVNKKTITLESDRIQEVNVNQPFIHRLLHIYQLEIDSPGTDKKEITINAVSFEDAQFLQQFLLDKKKSPSETSVLHTEERNILKIGVPSILKFAITANYFKSFVALIGILLYIHQQISETFAVDVAEYLPTDSLEKNLELMSIFGIIAIFLLLAVVGILINVLRTLVIYFNLKITKYADYFAMEYGLFNTKNQIINKNKVQITSITQNYFQRLGDVLQLKFSQIGGEDAKSNSATVPGCNAEEKDALLTFIYGEIPHFSAVLQPNVRYLIPRILFFILLPLGTAFFLSPDELSILPFAIFYSIFAATLIYFSFKNCKLSLGENYIQKQDGAWDVEQKTFEIEKIQALKISQYFWQRKAGLANITCVTAGGNIKLSAANKEELKKWMNFILFKVESSSKNWM